MAKQIGVLTGGGDCPGLNAVIRGVVRRSLEYGNQTHAIRSGLRGLYEGWIEPLGEREVSGILPRGGTILGTSRFDPWDVEGAPEQSATNLRDYGLDALVVIGGDGTLATGDRLHRELGVPVVGVPKTIDNDISATDYT